MTTETEPTAEVQALGRYQLVHALGQGGMGEVFLAKITGAAGFEKPCIVKTILPALLSDRQFLDRFHHEAKVLVHLVHSNIAQVYDMGEAEGTYYMALEYVAGVDLSQLMEELRGKNQPMPIPVALFLGARVAEGLGYAHRKSAPDGTPLGIVHRDVSPHNVMVGYEGEVKVIDFGLARSAARSRYTLPSTVMGKLGYMSPEQARAEPLDHRTDIYACGLIVWELLAGRPALAQGTVGEMMAAMANPRIPLLHEVRPEIDPGLSEVVQQALSPDPAGRPNRADDFARKLNEHLIRLGNSVGAEEVGQFVRTTCPEAFAAQRKLISRLSTVSTLKRTPIPLDQVVAARQAQTSMQRRPAPPVAGPDDDDGGIGATYVRTPSTENQPAAAVDDAPLKAPKSKGPILALLAVVLLAVGAGAAYVVTQQTGKATRSGPEVPKAEAPSPPAPPAVLEEKVAAVTPPPAPAEAAEEAPAEEAEPETPEAEAPPEDVATEEPEPAAEEPKRDGPRKHRAHGETEYVTGAKVMGLIRDRSGTYTRAGAEQGLTPGALLKVVGKRERGKKRRVLGTATVLQVHPKLARLALDRDAKKARGKKFIVLPEAPPKPKPPEVAAVKPPDPKPEAEKPAVLPPPPPLATATTKPATLQNPGTALQPVAAVQPPPPPKKRTLSGRITTGGAAMFRYITVHNADSSAWHDCVAFIREDGKYPAKYNVGAAIPKGGTREIELRSFRRDPRARMVPPNMVGITCKEGEVNLPAVW